MIYIIKTHTIDNRGNVYNEETFYAKTEADAVVIATDIGCDTVGDGFYQSDWEPSYFGSFDPSYGDMARHQARIISQPTTHGGSRPNAGRNPISDADDLTERHTVTLPASLWRRIEDAGGGNRSAGIRRLVHMLDTAKEL